MVARSIFDGAGQAGISGSRLIVERKARNAVLERLGNSGCHFARTIFAEAHTQMSITRDDIVGPVLGVQNFDTPEDAVAMANDTNTAPPRGFIHRNHCQASRSFQMTLPTIG